MQHKFIATALFLLLSTPALADNPGPPPGDRMVRHLDADGDGLVSFDEFRMPGTRMLRRLDTDGNGSISHEEVQAHRREIQARRAERAEERAARMDRMFDSMDTDGDGAVTAAEMRRGAFDRMDSNHDGYLSGEEFRRPHHRPGRFPRHRFPPPEMDDE